MKFDWIFFSTFFVTVCTLSYLYKTRVTLAEIAIGLVCAVIWGFIFEKGS